MIGWLLRSRGRHAGDRASGAPARTDHHAAWQLAERADRAEARLDQHDARFDRQDYRTEAIFEWLRRICEETGVKAGPPLRAVPDEEEEEAG